MGQKPCLNSSASGPAISVSSYSMESSELSLGKAKPPLTLRFPFDVSIGEVHIPKHALVWKECRHARTIFGWEHIQIRREGIQEVIFTIGRRYGL